MISTFTADAQTSIESLDDPAALQAQLNAISERLNEIESQGLNTEIYQLKLDTADIHILLDAKKQAWDIAKTIFDLCIEEQNWEKATEACDVMFRSEQEDALAALGQGIWLAVTYPIDPGLTIKMLEHIISETPSDSDGAAVAAMTASYIADLRTTGKQRENLMFFTQQLMGKVAERHGNVTTQEEFNNWLDKLGLHKPDQFLPRLKIIIDVLIQDNWWFDHDELKKNLPIN